MYENINDVPEVIKDFYFEETVSEPTGELIAQPYFVEEYDEETGEPTGEQVERTRQIPEMADVTYVRQATRPETKSKADLERVIGLGKPLAVITKFADMVALGEQWEWFDDYQSWKSTNDELVALNVDLPKHDDEGLLVQAEYALADEPERPTIRTGSDVFAPYARDVFKKDRQAQVDALTVTVDDMVFDGDESSQERMNRAITVLDETETTLWVLTDNQVVYPTREQLRQALKLAGQAQTAIWVQ